MDDATTQWVFPTNMEVGECQYKRLVGNALNCGASYRGELVNELETDGWSESRAGSVVYRIVALLIPAGTDPRGDDDG